MSRACAVACAAAVLAMLAFAGSATAGGSSQGMVGKINKYRAAHGLGPLRSSAALARGSGRHARRLIRTDSFSHAALRAGGRFDRLGEVLGYQGGFRIRRSAMVRMWLRSPGHRRLVLSRSFRYVGAGMARGRFNGSRATVWVARFGS
jgi:uncharacterized protein YkwD